jgi:hypothetical protein
LIMKKGKYLDDVKEYMLSLLIERSDAS